MKPIQYKSIGYNILRAYTKLFARNFYKKTTVVGLENIPDNKPVLFALNHQNALMDALNTLYAIKQQPVFMARADIFKKKRTAAFLRWIKILPIYRIRDGVKSLQNNDAVFEEAIGVLEDNKILALLPEGTHGDKRRLCALKKGIARIAFKAEERNNFELGVQIIPVGLDYSEYIKTGGELLVNFGKPFDLNPFKEIYLQDEQQGFKKFLDELRPRLLAQMWHVNDKENYDEIYTLSNLYVVGKEKLGHLEKMHLKQKVSDQIIELQQSDNKKFNGLIQNAKQIRELLKKLNLRDWVLQKEKYCSYKLPVRLSKNVKDPQFLSSFRFVLGFIIFTLFYLLYLIILLVMFNWWIVLLIFVSIPLLGKFSYRYLAIYKKIMAQFRVNRLFRKKNKDYMNLRALWSEVQSVFGGFKMQ